MATMLGAFLMTEEDWNAGAWSKGMAWPLKDSKLRENPEALAKMREGHAAFKKAFAAYEELMKVEPELAQKEGVAQRARVFTRARPLSESEEKDSKELISGLTTKTSLPEKEGDRVSTREGISGFHGVFGIESKNKDVYENTLKLALPVTLEGGATSVFCYGHTGTGKTHTTLGYATEPGLFRLACEDLFAALAKANEKPDEGGKLHLQVRFTELYLGKVFDLLSNRAPCTLREDNKGVVHIRKKVERKVEDGDPRVESGDQAYTVVKSIDHLMTVLADGIKLRAVGASSQHDQSSRSHALLEMEIVNDAVSKAREELAQAKIDLSTPAWKLDELQTQFPGLMFKQQKREKQKDDQKEGFDNQTDWKTYFACDDPESPQSVDEMMKKCEEWFIEVNKAMDSASKITKLVNEIKVKESKLMTTGPKILGGRLTLVDLAGADYDDRDLKQSTKTELGESAQINKDLFSLKNVMKDLGGKKKRLAWRDCKLTMVLRGLMQPLDGGSSLPVMIATISPSATQDKESTNTMRYAQMVAGGGKAGGKKTQAAERAARRAAEMISQIKQIYKEHCPEKSDADVEAILKKFQGKEATLLRKVRTKYASGKRKEPPTATEQKPDAKKAKPDEKAMREGTPDQSCSPFACAPKADQ